MVTMRNRIDNSWSQIDVQLPSAVRSDSEPRGNRQGIRRAREGCFRGCHKGGVLPQARLRTPSRSRGRRKNQITQALKSLSPVAEAYPDLKANQNFMISRKSWRYGSKIAYARQFYNDTVMAYNTLIQSFPAASLRACSASRPRDYFPMDEPPASR